MKSSIRGKTWAVTAVMMAIVFFVGSCDFFQELFTDTSFKPGSTRADAPLIERDKDYTVELAGANDDHWYKFETNNDGPWDRVEVSVSDVVGSGVRISLLVQDSEFENRINSTARNDGANITRDFPTTGGTFYVRVTNHWLSGTGSYTLHVKNLDLIDEYEPNDTFDTAYDLGKLPATDIQATIVSTTRDFDGNYHRDIDWYKFETISQNDVVVSFTDVSDTLRVGFEFFHPNRNPLLGPYQYFELGQSVTFTMENMPPAGTVIYLKVFGSAQSSTHVNATRGDYTLSITQQPD